MENSEFDKFIKSNTHQELDVPEGLDWENMNIPLPPPEKKNRKIIFMLWFGLLFFAAGSMIYFYAKNANQNEAIALDKSEKTSSILETETIDPRSNFTVPSMIDLLESSLPIIEIFMLLF